MQLRHLLESYKSVYDILKTAAPQHLNAFENGNLLLRGINSLSRATLIKSEKIRYDNEFVYTLALYEIPIRMDRQPLSTPNSDSEQIDDWFENQFGVRPRKQGVFTVINDNPSESIANSYGSIVGAVFPKSPNTKFVFSPDVEDLYVTFSRAKRHVNINATDYMDIIQQSDQPWVCTSDISELMGYEHSFEVILCGASSYYFLVISQESTHYDEDEEDDIPLNIINPDKIKKILFTYSINPEFNAAMRFATKPTREV